MQSWQSDAIPDKCQRNMQVAIKKATFSKSIFTTGATGTETTEDKLNTVLQLAAYISDHKLVVNTLDN